MRVTPITPPVGRLQRASPWRASETGRTAVALVQCCVTASTSPLRHKLERPRLEADDDFAQASDALVVAGERAPAADRVDACPGTEADVRPGALDVAEEPRVRAEALSVAPFRPLAPASDEFRLPS